jgi:hypothetical protein
MTKWCAGAPAAGGTKLQARSGACGRRIGKIYAPIQEIPVPPSELDIRAARDRGALDDRVDVLAASFGMPREFGERLINDRVLRLPGCESTWATLMAPPLPLPAGGVRRRRAAGGVLSGLRAASIESGRQPAPQLDPLSHRADTGALLAERASLHLPACGRGEVSARGQTGAEAFHCARHLEGLAGVPRAVSAKYGPDCSVSKTHMRNGPGLSKPQARPSHLKSILHNMTKGVKP